MAQVIQQKFDKQLLSQLPHEEFQGRIIVVNNLIDAGKAVRYLMEQPIIGIDTETKPVFKKGAANKVALLQVSTHDTAFLFQLRFVGITDGIVKLMQSKKIKKVGLSLGDDFRALSARRKITPQNVVEIQELVKKVGIEDLSLQKIYAILFGEKIAKGQQLTNWEAPTLTPAQQNYGAVDAWACLKIYNYLKSGLFDPNLSPYKILEDNEQE